MGGTRVQQLGGRGRAILALLALSLLLSACGGVAIGQPSGTAIVALAEPTPTATATPLPTATPTVTPTQTPRPLPTPTQAPPTAVATRTPTPRPGAANSAILDFSRWDTGESEPTPGRHRRSYNGATGEYTVQVLEEEQEWSFYSPDTQQFLDFRLEVEARRSGGPDGTGYGLVFRRQPRGTGQETSERYVFYVTAQGYYGVFHLSSENKATWLKNLSPPPAGVARVGDASNKLTVVCRSAALQLLINGTVVYQDSNLKLVKAGGIGIFATSAQGSGQTTEVVFKNITLSTTP